MNLYHYSVSYAGSGQLINDYYKRYKDAESFIKAPEISKEIFSLYLERQIKDMKLTKRLKM